MIMGLRRSLRLTHVPTTRRTTCCSWCVVWSVRFSTASSRASLILGMISSKTESSSATPRAWISGPDTTLPVARWMTVMMEMKPSSPRVWRSLRSASVTSPTLEPST